MKRESHPRPSDHDRQKTDRRVMSNPVGQTKRRALCTTAAAITRRSLARASPRRREQDGWFVGSGLAALAGAAFLIRDGQMPGDKITILERLDSCRVARWTASRSREGLRDPRRSRDGGPLRVPVGPVPVDPVARDRRRERARRVLLARTRTIRTTRCSAPR